MRYKTSQHCYTYLWFKESWYIGYIDAQFPTAEKLKSAPTYKQEIPLRSNYFFGINHSTPVRSKLHLLRRDPCSNSTAVDAHMFYQNCKSTSYKHRTWSSKRKVVRSPSAGRWQATEQLAGIGEGFLKLDNLKTHIWGNLLLQKRSMLTQTLNNWKIWIIFVQWQREKYRPLRLERTSVLFLQHKKKTAVYVNCDFLHFKEL